MRRASIFLLLISGFPFAALAVSCSKVEPQLSHIALELSHSAIAAAGSAVKGIPTSYLGCPGVLLATARIAAAKGDAQAAERQFGDYVKIAPEDPLGYAYFARLLVDEGEYSQADAMSAAALEKGPHQPTALAIRGQLLAMKGDRQRGEEMLKEACMLDPEDEESHFQLGALYDRAKLPGDAVVYFKKAVTLDPADVRAWDYLALDLEPLGEVDGAATAYKRALEVNREGPRFDAFLDYNYGRFLAKQGDLKTSKLHLDRAVELLPTMRASWYERAKLDLRLKDYQLARKDAEMAASLADPDHIIIDLQLYSILEQVYRRLGETELANKYAELGRDTLPPVRGEHH